VNEETIRPDSEDIHGTAELIEQTLSEFGVPARVTGYRVGPTVTQFAVEPGFIDKTNANGEVIQQKVRVSQISGLARDLALRLSAQRLRIEAPVAGQSFVGIEVPNDRNSMVRLRSMLESTEFSRAGSSMAIALGKDVSGLSVIGDLITMPHILIAGTTGSGKSICIQAITMCLVMNNTPADLRIAILDPKMVELARFNGLPHMLGQVETKPERMIAVLSWALAEMGERYKLLEMHNARDLDVYNRKIARKGETPLPRIVIIIDELADLMMSMPEQTEHALVRLAQMARATGIHLVVATQRPSTNVITGLIKANFPTRISFSVASSVDSRVILDTTGAETLLGRGDLLYLNPEVGTPIRAQGVYVTDREIERVVNFWQKLEASDDTTIPWEEMVDQLAGGEDEDAMLSKAIAVIKKSQKASASLLQRRLHVGYPRAARMIDQLEGMGLVGPAQPGGREREVLVDPDDDGEPIGLDED
jgi:S-DNA-T family DNA segregation ATPase FtsK/SpoIIIE